MNNQNQVQGEVQQEHSQIHFDVQLLNRKKMIIERCIQNEEDGQHQLLNYPNQQLKKIAQDQIKVNGRLVVLKNTSSLYFGEVCNDLYHGYGLLIYKNAVLRFYEGQFQNNCKYGYGLQYINGDIYIGRFLNNKPEDENGIFIWNNGDIYHGSFVNGMKHGMGKWQSGEQFYSGNWKFNKPEGQGYIKSSISDYNGDVKNGYKHGQGLEIFKNGDKYDGMYSNGKPEGIGTYSWANGSIYKGEFKNGLRFGNGVWQFGSEKYEGSYINDKRNGEGVYKWSGGSFYKGSFVEDLRHGYGQMHWDGSFYKGEWLEGMQHGEGQMWENDKLVQKGVFQNGKLKIQNTSRESQQKPVYNLQPIQSIRKVQTQKNTQILPNFDDRKRFNSFNNVKQEQFRAQKQRPQKVFHQSFYHKQNELLLQKKRQINKRYSFLDRYSDKKSFGQGIKFINKKSQQKSVEKSKEKEERPSTKTSLMKIQLYKKLRKQKESTPTNRKQSTKQPKQFQTPMFETQLQPIRWRNFAHFSSG